LRDVVRADAEVEVGLKRNADEVCDEVLGFLGEFFGAFGAASTAARGIGIGGARRTWVSRARCGKSGPGEAERWSERPTTTAIVNRVLFMAMKLTVAKGEAMGC
jgi:hypothetical protein